jgi:tRNA A-37 threonylcarbamoyl transferase component Bud32
VSGGRELDWQALSPYLDQLLDLPDEDRAAFIENIAASTPELATQLRDSLAAYERANATQFLRGEALDVAGAAVIGQHVGPYTLDRVIGQGGMGTVWLAHRSDGQFEGRVAVKLLSPALVGRPSEIRFLREGRMLAGLRHRNIANLLDAGRSPYGQHFLVLEFIDGLRIDQYCDQRELSVRERLQLFLQVLAAVGYAHRHLIVHRDIKPSNILVDVEGSAKLLDFGVAALTRSEPASAVAHDLTREVGQALTPEYAAPEQLLGEPVSTAADIYALGLVLFVLLAGKHPFGSRATTQDSDAPRLSQSTADRQRARNLRGDLDNIVGKALKYDAGERYTTAEAFADDVRNYLADKPVNARRDTWRYRVGKFVSRHRIGVAAATAAVLMLAAAAVITTRQMYEARQQRDQAVRQTRIASASADFLQLVLAENRSAEHPVSIDELLDRAVDMLERQYGGDQRFVADMYMLLAGERDGRREIAKARDLLQRAERAANQANDASLATRANCRLSILESREGLMTDARASLAQSRWNQTSPAADWRTEVDCLHAQANIDGAEPQGRESSLALLLRARERIEREGETHDRSYTTILSYLAVAYRANGDLPRALEYVQLGGRIHEENGRGQTRSRLLALNNEAVILWYMGEIRANYAIRKRLMAQLATFDRKDHAFFNTNFVLSALRMRDFAVARQYLTGSIEHAQERGDVLLEIKARLSLLNFLQRTTAPRAQIAAQMAVLEPMLRQTTRHIPESDLQEFQLLRARLESSDGNYASARQQMTELLVAAEKKGDKRDVANALAWSAQVALDAGDAAAATDFAARGAGIAQSFARTLDSSADVGDLLLLQARAAAQLGKLETRALFERAIRCLSNGYGLDHEQTRAAHAALDAYLRARSKENSQ